MRPIDVHKTTKGFTIYVGHVMAGSNYRVLQLSEAEAATLLEKLKTQLYG